MQPIKAHQLRYIAFKEHLLDTLREKSQQSAATTETEAQPNNPSSKSETPEWLRSMMQEEGLRPQRKAVLDGSSAAAAAATQDTGLALNKIRQLIIEWFSKQLDRLKMLGDAFHSGYVVRRTLEILGIFVFALDQFGLYGLSNLVLFLQRRVYSLFQVIYALLFVLYPTRDQREELRLAMSGSDARYRGGGAYYPRSSAQHYNTSYQYPYSSTGGGYDDYASQYSYTPYGGSAGGGTYFDDGYS